MNTNEFFAGFFIGFSIFCYYKRHKTPFKEIWKVVSIFWLTLLVILSFNYVKDKLSK